VSRILEAGLHAVRAGEREKARDLFMQAVRDEPENVDAWVWLAEVLDDPQQRIECYQRVLALEPNHLHARKQVAALQNALAGGPPRTAHLPMGIGLAGVGLLVLIAAIFVVVYFATGGEPRNVVFTPTPETVLAEGIAGETVCQLLSVRSAGTHLDAEDVESGGPPNGRNLAADGVFYEVTFRVRNRGGDGFNWIVFTPALLDAREGEHQPLLEANDWVDARYQYTPQMLIKLNETRVLRLFYDLTPGVPPTALRIPSAAMQGFAAGPGTQATLAFAAPP
jgi:tetratricopeptide (TPR) repeat protein